MCKLVEQISRDFRDTMLGGVHHANRASTFIVTVIAAVLDVAQIGVQMMNTLGTVIYSPAKSTGLIVHAARKVGVNAVGTNFYKLQAWRHSWYEQTGMILLMHSMGCHAWKRS